MKWKAWVATILLAVGCATTAGAQFVGPPQNVASDSDTNQPFALHVKTFGADTVAVTFGPGGTITANQGTPAVQANRWPVFWSDGTVERIGQQTMANSIPVAIASNQSAVPVSGTVAVSSVPVATPLTSIVTGQQAVTAIATALPSNTGKIVCIRIIDTGTQTVSFGPTGVTTATGQQLIPGEGACRPLDNSNRIFVIAGGVGSTIGFEVYN